MATADCTLLCTACALRVALPCACTVQSGGATQSSSHASAIRQRHKPPQLSQNLLGWLSRAEGEADSDDKAAKQATRAPLKPFASQGFQSAPRLVPSRIVQQANSKLAWPGDGLCCSLLVSAAHQRSPAGLAKQGPRKPIPKVPGKATKAAPKAGKPAAPKAATAKRPASDTAVPAAKRPAPAAGGPAPAADGDKDKPARQRKKASDVDAAEAEAAVRAAHAAGTLAKVPMLELKAFLKAHGKPVGGKKAEILERAQALLAA